VLTSMEKLGLLRYLQRDPWERNRRAHEERRALTTHTAGVDRSHHHDTHNISAAHPDAAPVARNGSSAKPSSPTARRAAALATAYFTLLFLVAPLVRP